MTEFFNAVIPAKAGIQALNGVARFARDLNSYLWVADPRQVTFSCLSKKKSPKRRTPRSARQLPSYPGCADPRRTRSAAWKSTGLPRLLRLTLAPPGARPTRRARKCRARRASISEQGYIFAPRARTRSRLKAPGEAAVLGARYGGLKNSIMIYRMVAAVFLVVLTNLSFAEEGVKENSENCIGINAFRCREPNEAEVLKKYPLLAKRDGKTLKLNIQNGSHLQFEDCADTSCAVYQFTFQEFFAKQGYLLIKKQTIEEATYLFVDQKTGKEIDVDELPLFSPDASRFVTTSVCEAFCTDRIQIWRFVQNDLKMELTIDPEELSRESWADGSARWIDNSTIEVTKVMRINLENKFETHKAFQIKHSPGGWRVVKTK